MPAQDRPPLSRWGRGRVTLLGDAAHPMLPSLGQGANSAIEDAVVLAHAVATHSDPETALRTYERRRLRRTTALVDGSRALGRIEQTTNLAVTTARNRIVRYTREKQLLATMTKPMIWPGFGDEPRFGPTPRPLSSLERWHWTADQAAPLHIASSVRISGRVDADTIRAALDALVHRHPILRTAIRSDGGIEPALRPRAAPTDSIATGRRGLLADRDRSTNCATVSSPMRRCCARPSSPSSPAYTTSC